MRSEAPALRLDADAKQAAGVLAEHLAADTCWSGAEAVRVDAVRLRGGEVARVNSQESSGIEVTPG
ncbi:hypothetical protein BJF78_30170 [Pseudonocardia sp. CNS-139]|nr:hypothetical protein BJF78_30170 [Pseudonocardia sp. CNS-139]